MWIPPPPPGAYAGPPKKKRSKTGLWVALGGLAVLVLIAGAGLGAFFLLRPGGSSSAAGGDTAETPGTHSDMEAVTSEPTRKWSWKSSDEIRWTADGPDFTIAVLEGEAGFVVLDDDGKERWRAERHNYSGAWVDEDAERIQASWYGPISTDANGETTSDSGTIVYDFDGEIVFKDTDDDHFVESVEEDGTYLVHDSEAKTLKKVSSPDDKGEWTISGENITTTDDWIYAVHGDTLARYSREDGILDWKIDMPAGWKGPKFWYDIKLDANDDLVVVVGHATYGFSAEKGEALWNVPGEGAVTSTAGDRIAVIEDGRYDETQGITMPSNGPYPIFDETGKVGELPFSTARPYGAVQMVKVDGKGDQLNFGIDEGALYDADGKLLEDGYDHAYQALDAGVYLLDKATLSFRTWHEEEDVWTLTLSGVDSIGDTINHRDVSVGFGDGHLVVNDKHNLWFYE